MNMKNDEGKTRRKKKEMCYKVDHLKKENFSRLFPCLLLGHIWYKEMDKEWKGIAVVRHGRPSFRTFPLLGAKMLLAFVTLNSFLLCLVGTIVGKN